MDHGWTGQREEREGQGKKDKQPALFHLHITALEPPVSQCQVLTIRLFFSKEPTLSFK